MLHDLQLNAWVLAYRRILGSALLMWEGETDIEPPRHLQQAQLGLDGDWTARGLREPQARLLRPDAVLEIARGDDEPDARTLLIEYDRTRRVDKNYGKFRRYDAFLISWWRQTRFGDAQEPPFVLFICQDEHQREQFMAAADRELNGHHWHPSVAPERYEYTGRRQILFALERDMHAGCHDAWRLPVFPPDHPHRAPDVRYARLPSHGPTRQPHAAAVPPRDPELARRVRPAA